MFFYSSPFYPTNLLKAKIEFNLKNAHRSKEIYTEWGINGKKLQRVDIKEAFLFIWCNCEGFFQDCLFYAYFIAQEVLQQKLRVKLQILRETSKKQ